MPSIDINNAPKPPPPPLPIDNVNIGDKVEMTNGETGIVKYIGNIHVKKGIWIGIELDEASGNHDGKIKGKRYFKTKPNHATFVKYKKINKIIASSSEFETSESEVINENESIEKVSKDKKSTNVRIIDNTSSDTEAIDGSISDNLNMNNIDIDIPSPPMHPNENSRLSSPSIPPVPTTPHSLKSDSIKPIIDLDEHTGDFDIAAFEIIKVKQAYPF